MLSQLDAALRDGVKRQAQMEHPALLQLYDFFDDEERIYIVTENPSGELLDDYIKR